VKPFYLSNVLPFKFNLYRYLQELTGEYHEKLQEEQMHLVGLYKSANPVDPPVA
jgi:hypothetical protein